MEALHGSTGESYLPGPAASRARQSSWFTSDTDRPLSADCFISRLHLHAYVDGELDCDIPGSALREVILMHLAQCDRCTKMESLLRAMRRRLRDCGEAMAEHADERAHPDFRARVTRLLAG